MIQQRMEAGEFDSLAGAGKPLPDGMDFDPLADRTTQKLNQMLAETGFLPEWVQLQKDIGVKREKIRKELRDARQRLGPGPLDGQRAASWASSCQKLEEDEVVVLNKMIAQYNLIVPNMNNQMFVFNLALEAEKIINS